MIFVKISQNFIKSHLKICLVSQISVHSLWHVCRGGHNYSSLKVDSFWRSWQNSSGHFFSRSKFEKLSRIIVFKNI